MMMVGRVYPEETQFRECKYQDLVTIDTTGGAKCGVMIFLSGAFTHFRCDSIIFSRSEIRRSRMT